jgi:hypothetical protein
MFDNPGYGTYILQAEREAEIPGFRTAIPLEAR